MLWYKSWLDTRWAFLIALALLVVLANGSIFAFSTVQEIVRSLPPPEPGDGSLSAGLREEFELQTSFRGYIWSQWFRQQPTQLGTLFAALLGTGGLVSPAGGGALFTMSLPVSRHRLVATRAAAGLIELLAIAVVSSLAIAMVSPAVGQTFSVGSALVHALCWFVAGAVFFSLALLLSTVFSDIWRPLLIACGVAFAWALLDLVLRDLVPFSIFRVMSAETYFRTGSVPWPGLIASAAIATAVLYGAAVNFARRDF